MFRKFNLLYLAAILGVLVLIGFGIFLYVDFVSGNIHSYTADVLNGMSARDAAIVKVGVDNQLDALSDLSDKVSKLGEADRLSVIKQSKYKQNIDEIFLVDRKLNVYTGEGIVFGVYDHEPPEGVDRELFETLLYVAEEGAFAKVFGGETAVTDPSPNGSVFLCVPVYNSEGKIDMTLAAKGRRGLLADLLGISGSMGRSVVVKSDGRYLSNIQRIPGKEPSDPSQNVFEDAISFTEKNAKALEMLKLDMSSRKHGFVSLRLADMSFVSYAYTGINDWYVLCIVEQSVISDVFMPMLNGTYILCAAVLALIVAFVAWLVINERRKTKRLNNIVYTDPLTGGYSFERFILEAKKLLYAKKVKYALAVMEIEDFNLINEVWGHSAGDKALTRIWSFYKQNIKDDEVFARNEGTKYVYLMRYEEGEDICERVERFGEGLKNIKNKDGYVLRPRFGVYNIEEKDYENIDIKHMYNFALIAVASIRNNQSEYCALFTQELSDKMKNSGIMESRIEEAYNNEEFVVYYQPKYDAETKRMIGAEALIRWKLEDGTIVPPYKFIPIAENNGFIVKLDKYIFKRVCENQKMWLDSGLPIVPVSVNLSRKHFYNPAFTGEYKEMVNSTHIPVEYVQLEITESAMFDNQTEFLNIVGNLKNFGFQILMDDFGTGYSSLMMLKSIPIDILKLDKSFVDDYNDSKGEQIITHITKLAKSINISVTAEGVETEDQYVFLKNLGCDSIQGYYFAKPMSEDDFEEQLRKSDNVA